MTIRHSILSIFVVAIALTSCSRQSEKDLIAVDGLRAAFNTAYNAQNTQVLDSIIDEDAIWSIPGEPSVIGKDSVVVSYDSLFAKSHPIIDVKAGDLQLCKDWAILTTEYTKTDSVKTDSATVAKEITGHYLMVFRKHAGGNWRIARAIWTEPEQ
ncbi:MAG: nuclear transport factor 2 family protein [Bacteroidota bacterium]|nr:nuclear transport factor 2 family protein [Bacteroidota bacterium]